MYKHWSCTTYSTGDKCRNFVIIYSLYKKKRKHYIIFNNLRTFKDEHFKLTGDLDWHVPYE